MFNPDIQYLDGTGVPLVGAQLFFYNTGTSTKLNTYSNSALTIANTNPIILDSNGRAGAIFLQNLSYKVVLAPASDTDPPTSPIWTQDPVYASDFSTVAQVQSVNGNPNGQLAGTQGSATIPASMAWDYTNDILYVCTTTGTSSTAVWTAVNPATGGSVVLPPPQGRLTLISNTPVINVDTASATTVYYTPYTGLLVPIYNGTSFSSLSIVSQLSLGLVGAHAANAIYDLYIFSLSGTLTLGSGPSWAAGTSGSITAGSCARGTGAGGAALARLGGFLTNSVSMTMTYGPSGATTTVPANQGTYVGSMFIDSTNGQLTCNISYGQNRKWGLWNAYNRVPIQVQAGDGTANWTYATNTIRASDGAPSSYTANNFNAGSGTACNGLIVFNGLAEETATALFTQNVSSSTGNNNPTTGIGLNSTTAYSGVIATQYSVAGDGGTFMTAYYSLAPSLGINIMCALENAATTQTVKFFGTNSNMLLQATWRG